MNEKAMFEEIIALLKKGGWKGQVCGMVTFSGSTGTNLYKNGKLLSLSITEEGHMTYPDQDELKEMFGEVKKNDQSETCSI